MPEIVTFPEVTLKDLSRVVTDGSHFSPTPQSTGVAIANVKDLRDGYVDLDSCTRISESAYERLVASGCTINPGDVLFSKDGTIGKVVVYEQPDTIAALSSICIIRPRSEFSNRFLGQALQSLAFGKQVAAAISGSALRRLVLREIARLTIPAPPLAEQRLIAEILDTVDAAIRRTEQLIAKLQQVKRGLLNDLLTRGIDDNGELRNPERYSTQFEETRLGRLPTKWRVETLGNVAALVTSGSRGWARYYSKGGALFIRIGNLSRESIDLRLTDAAHVQPPAGGEGERTRVEEGDLLISITADLGLTGVVPEGLGEAYVNQHIALVRVDPRRVNPRWLGHFVAARGVQTQIRQHDDPGAKAGLNLPTVRGLLIAVPPIAEQEEITSRLDAAYDAIAGEDAYREKLNLLKRGLAEDLLTGRVRATKLLEGDAA